MAAHQLFFFFFKQGFTQASVPCQPTELLKQASNILLWEMSLPPFGSDTACLPQLLLVHCSRVQLLTGSAWYVVSSSGL